MSRISLIVVTAGLLQMGVWKLQSMISNLFFFFQLHLFQEHHYVTRSDTINCLERMVVTNERGEGLRDVLTTLGKFLPPNLNQAVAEAEH